MATVREIILGQSESQTFEVDTSSSAALEVSVDPGASRLRSSSDPPIGGYILNIRDSDGNDIGTSPVSSTSSSRQSYVVSDIGGLVEVEITNTGTRGAVVIEIAALSGDDATRAIQTGTSLDVGGSRSHILSESSFLEGRTLADDGRVYDDAQDAVDAASVWVKLGSGAFAESGILTIDTDGLTVEGLGRPTVLNNPVEVTALDVTLESFRIDDPDSSISTVAADQNNGADRLTCRKVIVEDSGVDGFNIIVSRARFEDCKVLSATGSGIATGDRNDVGGHLVSRCEIRNVDIGVFFGDGTVNSKVEGCLVEDTDRVGISMAWFETMVEGNIVVRAGTDGIKYIADNNSVDDNIVVAPVGDGVFGDSILSPSHGSITDNTILDAGGDGVEANGTDELIANNTIVNPGASAIDTAGATTPTTDSNVVS